MPILSAQLEPDEQESRCIAVAILASESLTLHMNSAIPIHEQTATIPENIVSPLSFHSLKGTGVKRLGIPDGSRNRAERFVNGAIREVGPGQPSVPGWSGV